jgi:hypothetical protein
MRDQANQRNKARLAQKAVANIPEDIRMNAGLEKTRRVFLAIANTLILIETSFLGPLLPKLSLLWVLMKLSTQQPF